MRGGGRPPRHLFDRNEAVVQPLEPWLSAVAESSYKEPVRTIDHLAPSLDARRLQTPGLGATLAAVALPLKPGHEVEVLDRLAVAFGQPGFDAVRFVTAFESFRERRYGRVDHPVASQHDRDAATPTRATPAGAAEWPNSWEAPRNRRESLEEWTDTTPTDGVRVEAALGHCGGALDELSRSALATNWVPGTPGADPAAE